MGEYQREKINRLNLELQELYGLTELIGYQALKKDIEDKRKEIDSLLATEED